jgi:hypoxanthine phosphoribosyltransferase
LGTRRLKPMHQADRTAGRIEVIFSQEAIADRIEAMANNIAAAGLERPLIVSVLTGSFVFSADLLRALHRAGVEPEVDFLSLSSYQRDTTSVGSVRVVRDLELEVAGRDILLVDDILDTGRTLAFARDLIAARGARRIVTCVLLNKRMRRAVDIEADYIAFECPPVFVLGYGMDLAHRFRELPFVGHLTSPESKP